MQLTRRNTLLNTENIWPSRKIGSSGCSPWRDCSLERWKVMAIVCSEPSQTRFIMETNPIICWSDKHVWTTLRSKRSSSCNSLLEGNSSSKTISTGRDKMGCGAMTLNCRHYLRYIIDRLRYMHITMNQWEPSMKMQVSTLTATADNLSRHYLSDSVIMAIHITTQLYKTTKESVIIANQMKKEGRDRA